MSEVLFRILLLHWLHRFDTGHLIVLIVEREKKRETLKALFLYKCISHGYPQIEFGKTDISSAVYMELSNYAPEAYSKVDSFAKEFVNKIGYEGTYYEDEKVKGVFFDSMEYLKNKKFDNFIKSPDKYMIK